MLSRIPDPDFYPSRIPDLRSRIQKQQQKRGVIKNLLYFFCSHKFYKNEYYFIFEMLKKEICPIFKELLKFLPKHFSLCSQIYGFGIQGSKRHRIPDPDPQHWLLVRFPKLLKPLLLKNSEKLCSVDFVKTSQVHFLRKKRIGNIFHN